MILLLIMSVLIFVEVDAQNLVKNRNYYYRGLFIYTIAQIFIIFKKT